jgi:hypothetical protein
MIRSRRLRDGLPPCRRACRKIPQPITFLQTGDHPVESRLQLAEFGAPIDVDHVVNAATQGVGAALRREAASQGVIR